MSLRLFAAIAIPDEVAARLVAIQRGVPGAKWRPRQNLHLTLRFFDEVQEPVAEELDLALEQAARSVNPFDVALKGAGFFGGANPDALVIKAEATAPLMKLAAECEKAARRTGLAPETRKYQPHVTIAYLGNSSLDRVIAFERAHGLFAPPSFAVAEFGLYSSHTKRNAPSQYQLEASYPLG